MNGCSIFERDRVITFVIYYTASCLHGMCIHNYFSLLCICFKWCLGIRAVTRNLKVRFLANFVEDFLVSRSGIVMLVHCSTCTRSGLAYSWRLRECSELFYKNHFLYANLLQGHTEWKETVKSVLKPELIHHRDSENPYIIQFIKPPLNAMESIP